MVTYSYITNRSCFTIIMFCRVDCWQAPMTGRQVTSRYESRCPIHVCAASSSRVRRFQFTCAPLPVHACAASSSRVQTIHCILPPISFLAKRPVCLLFLMRSLYLYNESTDTVDKGYPCPQEICAFYRHRIDNGLRSLL